MPQLRTVSALHQQHGRVYTAVPSSTRFVEQRNSILGGEITIAGKKYLPILPLLPHATDIDSAVLPTT